MATKRLSEKATFVTRGYGQVEPNHLSARRTGQIYAQLPADPSIDLLENGQFVKYDYAHKVVTLGKATVNLKEGVSAETGEESKGEWMLVLNEVKLYEDREQYEDFAMLKGDYNARIYSPIGQNSSLLNTILKYAGEANREGGRGEPMAIQIPKFEENPPMPKGSTMVPRVFKTNIGDIFTTNTIAAVPDSLKVGDLLTPGADGYLTKDGADTAEMQWQVAKVYTLADNQPAVKIQRIA